MAQDSGRRNLRLEDDALLRGQGRFGDDVVEPGQAHAVFLRAPMASADIRAIDIAAARAAPGVLLILTGADLKELGSLAAVRPVPGRHGGKTVVPRWPALAESRVVHAGQPVAIVVAETAAQAQDAAELIAIDYGETPGVADPRAALEPGAPQVWPEAPGNLCFDFTAPIADPDGGNAKGVVNAFAGAAFVARLNLSNQRVSPAPMEPRTATGRFDLTTGYTLRTGTQSAWSMAQQLAPVMGEPPARIRVVNDDVGGAFGAKSGVYPEYAAVLAAAKRLGRPVHWCASRAEAFLSDNRARGIHATGELALDRDGNFLALRVNAVADVGAFAAGAGVVSRTVNFVNCYPCVYRIPHVLCDIRCAFTNTVQFGPYRGAGRPEANYLLERLIEEAARLSGIDSVTLRRRNLLPPAAMPFKTVMGLTFDSGDFPAVFEKAMALADPAGFAMRRKLSAARGKRRGFGISCFLEHSGALPLEGAAVVFPGGGRVEVLLGAQNSGQGHFTIFTQVAAEVLDLDPARITVREGDSALGVEGHGTIASRGTSAAGSALYHTAQAVLAKGKRVAAILLEADEADIVYRTGFYEIAGTDRRVSLFDAASRAAEVKQETLDTNKVSNTPLTFPNGCHIAEVEVDPETGKVELVSYSAVDDSGRIINPILVEGQLHGGLAQGMGQALMENAIYDANGQLLAGSFMDYAMPRAADMPATLHDAVLEIPCTTNPLGVKGAGEAGTTGALAAIMNAVADALPDGAGRGLDMPATPLAVWQALRTTGKP